MGHEYAEWNSVTFINAKNLITFIESLYLFFFNLFYSSGNNSNTYANAPQLLNYALSMREGINLLHVLLLLFWVSEFCPSSVYIINLRCSPRIPREFLLAYPSDIVRPSGVPLQLIQFSVIFACLESKLLHYFHILF
jgi:hypothetical protein